MRQLRYFLAVADAGHISRAAGQLGMQQPPLSQQIKALEQTLGLRLFERHPKGVTLTDAGRLLQAEARQVLQQMQTLESRMQRLACGEQGRLALGFTSSAAAHAYMPRTLRECRLRFPHLRLELNEYNAAELTEGVLNQALHCGFLRVPVARPVGLVFETLFSEPLRIALPSGHPLVLRSDRGKTTRARASGAAPVLALGALRDEPFILVRRPGAPGLYAQVLAACEAEGFKPQVVAEVPRMLTNLNLVAAGAGISVVPASMQGVHPHAVVYCRLAPGSKLDAPMTLVWRQADQAGPTASFVALARQMVARVVKPAGGAAGAGAR